MRTLTQHLQLFAASLLTKSSWIVAVVISVLSFLPAPSLSSFCSTAGGSLTATTTAPEITASSRRTSYSSCRSWRCLLGVRAGANSIDDAYSFSLTTFSPRGSLTQLEYALNAVAEGSLAIGIKYATGVVLASPNRGQQSALVRESGTKKITHVSPSVAICYAGLAADSRVLASRAFELCLQYTQKFGSMATGAPLRMLVSELASMMQRYTQMGRVRPFGVSLLVAGVEDEDVDGVIAGGGGGGNSSCSPAEFSSVDVSTEESDDSHRGSADSGSGFIDHVSGDDSSSDTETGEEGGSTIIKPSRSNVGPNSGGGSGVLPMLYVVEPSGHHAPWKAVAVGKKSGEAERKLQEGWREGMTQEEAVKLALDVVLECTDDKVVSQAQHVDIACIERGKSWNQPHIKGEEGETRQGREVDVAVMQTSLSAPSSSSSPPSSPVDSNPHR